MLLDMAVLCLVSLLAVGVAASADILASPALRSLAAPHLPFELVAPTAVLVLTSISSSTTAAALSPTTTRPRPATTSSSSAVAATAAATTPLVAATTSTTTNFCDRSCTVNGMQATCKEQIQQASLSDFLGDPNSCALAQSVTADACPVCQGCPPHAAGCGILELPTTTAPTTTIPNGKPCNAVCTLGDQPATCSARVAWSANHVFNHAPQACAKAHAMVQSQCTVCHLCNIKQTGCLHSPELQAARAEDIFDCYSGAAVEWSQAKKAWCCEFHKQACDLITQDAQVFFEKKSADMEEHQAAAKTRTGLLHRRTLLATIAATTSFVILMGVASLLHRRSSVRSAEPSQRYRSFQVRGLSSLGSEDVDNTYE